VWGNWAKDAGNLPYGSERRWAAAGPEERVSLSGGAFFLRDRLRPGAATLAFLEKQSAQSPEVVQDPAASIHMHFQLFQIVNCQYEGIHPTRDVRFGLAFQIAFNFLPGLFDSFG